MSFNVVLPVSPVSGLTAIQGVKSAALRWLAPVDFTVNCVYEIWAGSTTDFASATKLRETRETHFSEFNLVADTTRYYWVRVRRVYSDTLARYSTVNWVSVSPEGVGSGSGTIADGSITTSKLANSAVTSAKIALGASGNQNFYASNANSPVYDNGVWSFYGQIGSSTDTYGGMYAFTWHMDAGLNFGDLLPGDHAVCKFKPQVTVNPSNYLGRTTVVHEEESWFGEHLEPEPGEIAPLGSSYFNGIWERTILLTLQPGDKFQTIFYMRTDIVDALGTPVTRGIFRPKINKYKFNYRKSQ
ncbi:hypothetical protein JL100_018020 [Skermanella mucosa]|uniref:hypothetical protein n=1 Tax=Skermanella mucosa TaxID=1789672 RepID=UPI00192A9670|nr:hypothetical protein [Skermanella mucosa]UEM18983.1 hypothetical protein JL100_018020 [Skermanella mucosa]